jgi:hypothetical protein
MRPFLKKISKMFKTKAKSKGIELILSLKNMPDKIVIDE